MKRVVLGLLVVTALATSAAPAAAYSHGHHSPGRHGHYAGYSPHGGHGRGDCYPPPRVHCRPVPVAVAPAYPVYPPYPPARQGFSYFTPGFSFSFSR